MRECWVARFDTEPCDGPLIRAHLLPKQLLRQRFPDGAVLLEGEWRSLRALRPGPGAGVLLTDSFRSLRTLMDDERAWVPCCGGATGLGGHHGRFDGLRVELPRGELPAGLEEFAVELGLDWWLERRWPR